MAGIADLTNIMMAGGRPDVPMPPPQGAGAPMGGPPPGPPMGGPPPGPPMGAPGMGEMAAAGAPPMGEMPMEQEGISIEEDSMALAEAVVGRAQGDVATAVAILDTAKQLLMSSAENAPVPAKDGRYLYRENGGTISDTDVLRQMIMEDLQNPEILEQGLAEAMAKLHGQTGRAVSDKDKTIDFANRVIDTIDDEIKARDKAMSDVMKFKML